MKILFVKESQNYPRSSGNDVHSYYLIRELASSGFAVSLLTMVPVKEAALEGLQLSWYGSVDQLKIVNDGLPLNPIRKKFLSFWGLDERNVDKVTAFANENKFDAVVVAATSGLVYLSAIRNAIRVWYAADDPVLHCWSMFSLRSPRTWKRFIEGLMLLCYQRAFSSAADRIWVVSRRDAFFSRYVSGMKRVDIIPNGVDSSYYRPAPVDKIPESCVFWGRLDFQPNLDAINWFGENIWKHIKSDRPTAKWAVYGFCGGEDVRRLQGRFGFELVCDTPDLREYILENMVAIMPFVSGGGVKNKLLEGAALGIPIVATSVARNGLEGEDIPVLFRDSGKEWIRSIYQLWDDSEAYARISTRIRTWVLDNHSWSVSASKAIKCIEEAGC